MEQADDFAGPVVTVFVGELPQGGRAAGFDSVGLQPGQGGLDVQSLFGTILRESLLTETAAVLGLTAHFRAR